MNRNRRLSIAGATLAGLIGVTALTGAASASADTLTSTKVSVPTASVPAEPADQAKPAVTPNKPADAVKPADAAKPPAAQPKPATDPKAPARPGADANGSHQARVAPPAQRSDWTLAKVKAAVLKAYPNATITSVTARDGGGWTVSLVTQRGHRGAVVVDRHFSVSKVVVTQARHLR